MESLLSLFPIKWALARLSFLSMVRGKDDCSNEQKYPGWQSDGSFFKRTAPWLHSQEVKGVALRNVLECPGLCILSLKGALKLTVFCKGTLRGTFLFHFLLVVLLMAMLLFKSLVICLLVCADSGTALENGEQESHGVQKPGKALLQFPTLPFGLQQKLPVYRREQSWLLWLFDFFFFLCSSHLSFIVLHL